jgi:hypothetical protein
MSYWDAVDTVHPLSPRVNITTAVDQLQPVGLRAGGVASQPSPERERYRSSLEVLAQGDVVAQRDV